MLDDLKHSSYEIVPPPYLTVPLSKRGNEHGHCDTGAEQDPEKELSST